MGRPLAPMILATWASSGVVSTNSALLPSVRSQPQKRILTTDLSLLKPFNKSSLASLPGLNLRVGFQERSAKTQITCRGPQTSILGVSEAQQKVTEVRVLGCSSVSHGARKPTTEEEGRLTGGWASSPVGPRRTPCSTFAPGAMQPAAWLTIG